MATWLDLFPEPRGWSLIDTGRMTRIVQDLEDPSKQFPTFFFFLGASQKLQALQSFFPHNNISRRSAAGIARLHAAEAPTRPHHPIWIVDGTTSPTGPYHRTVSESAPWPRHPLVDRPMAAEEARLHCYARILLPVMDLVCLFLDEVGGDDQGLSLLQRWIQIASQSSVPYNRRARLIIVQTSTSARWQPDLTAFAALPQYHQCFSQPPVVVDLQHRLSLSPRARFDPLRQVVQSEQQALHAERGRDHTQFSALHLQALVHAAFRAAAQRPPAPFDLVRATRVDRPVERTVAEHLATFLAQSEDLPQDNVVDFVASALLLDAYPPGMHRQVPVTVRIVTPR
jgi:hypothetical protein